MAIVAGVLSTATGWAVLKRHKRERITKAGAENRQGHWIGNASCFEALPWGPVPSSAFRLGQRATGLSVAPVAEPQWPPLVAEFNTSKRKTEKG
jgi:hypothetical protein